MTIQHIVLAEMKDGVSDEDAMAALEMIKGLKGKVPGVLEVQVGANFSDRSGGLSHGGIVTLESREALAGYGPHPAHQEVVAVLGPLVERIVSYDFEV